MQSEAAGAVGQGTHVGPGHGHRTAPVQMGEGAEGPGVLTHTPRGAPALATMAHTYWAPGVWSAPLLFAAPLLRHIPGAAEGRGAEGRACYQ